MTLGSGSTRVPRWPGPDGPGRLRSGVFLPGNRRKLWVRLVMIAAAAGLFVVGYQWGNRFQHRGGPPAIGGVLVAPPIDLSDFHLQDPDGRPVNRDRLAQGWALLTYGDLTQAQGQLAISRLIEVHNRLAERPELSAELRLVLVQSGSAPNLARDFNRLTPALDHRRGWAGRAGQVGGCPGRGPGAPPGDTAGALLFLIAPGGNLVALFTPGQGPATVAQDLMALADYPDLLQPPERPSIAPPATSTVVPSTEPSTQ